MAAYDSEVLEEYAEKLYSQARWIAISYFFCTYVITVLAGILLSFLAHTQNTALGEIVAVCLLPSGIAGFVGYQKSFMLRLEAQKILCQVQIERNTAIQ